MKSQDMIVEQRNSHDVLKIRHGVFNKIMRLASQMFKTPIAIVSVIDTDSLNFISQYGAKEDEITFDPGLHASVVSKQPLVIGNIESHSNPLSISTHGLKFYAGVPLYAKDGTHLGTFCILDKKPRSFSDDELDLMKEIGELIVDEIELRSMMKKMLSFESQLLKNALDAKAKAEYVANHDSLTGLANRLHFIHELDEELTDPHYVNKIPAVYMLDLDKFKPANDTYGHQFGDSVLKEVAKRIKECIGDDDVAARLGGDEFVILKRNTTHEEAEQLAECLVHSLSQPYAIDGIIAHLSSSVGFTLFTNPRDNSRQLIRNADLALYCAKSKGGKNYQLYNSSINQTIQTRHR